jgi:hypothetical protein
MRRDVFVNAHARYGMEAIILDENSPVKPVSQSGAVDNPFTARRSPENIVDRGLFGGALKVYF